MSIKERTVEFEAEVLFGNGDIERRQASARVVYQGLLNSYGLDPEAQESALWAMEESFDDDPELACEEVKEYWEYYIKNNDNGSCGEDVEEEDRESLRKENDGLTPADRSLKNRRDGRWEKMRARRKSGGGDLKAEREMDKRD